MKDDIKKIENELIELNKVKSKHISEGNYELAAIIRDKETILREKIEQLNTTKNKAH